jgi:cobalt-zinc-cadmium efflux system outer membrane protein
MKTTPLLLGAAACWMFSTAALAQQTIDFPTALELARKNNPEWKAAEQEVGIARGKLTTSRLISPFNPVIEGQGGRRTMPGEGRGADYGVGLSMEIEVAGQRGVRITEAERNLQRAEAAFSDFARTFTAKLGRAFYDAIFARERSALQRRIENLNSRLLEVTRTKFDAGDVSGLEVNVATVRYAQSRKEALDAERNLSQALLELRRLIGVEQAVSPTGDIGVTAPPLPIGDALQRALANRPDLIAKRYELQRAEAGIALVRREVYPNPSVGVFFNREGLGDKTVGAGLSIPLPVFNRRQGEMESLEARRIQARAELQASEKEIRKEVEQAIRQWETARTNADLFQRQVIEQTEENFRLLETAYRERKIDLPRLLIMENDLITANQSYLDVILSLREAAIRLQEVTGEIR